MTIKEQIHTACRVFIQKQVSEIEAAIADRREAMHNETKSSMGDKYETTREMLQQDINMNTQRLAEAQANLAILNSINPASTNTLITTGSVVETNAAYYFIAVSAGAHTIDGKKYYAVSASSPIGQQLIGKQTGEQFQLNGKAFTIKSVQ